MTPADFHASVLPLVLKSWNAACLCSQPGFRKLVSFRFEDYTTQDGNRLAPLALADCEILIHAIIRGACFEREEQPAGNETQAEDFRHAYVCRQCGARCQEAFDEYSINMSRSYVLFDGEPAPAAEGVFLVGFYGLRAPDFACVTDFRRTDSIDEFLAALTGS